MEETRYEQSARKIDEALGDIESAILFKGGCLEKDTSAVYAAIAQAKLLAVIASVLLEIKETYVHVTHL